MDLTNYKALLAKKEMERIVFNECSHCEGSGFGCNIDGSCPECMGTGDESYQYFIDRVF